MTDAHRPIVTARQGSLTDGDESVLVNASNTEVALGSGVSAAIRAACGPGYQDHIRACLAARYGGSMPPGALLVTDAGAAPRARHVVHAAVMDYRQGGAAGATNPDVDRVRTICRALWPAVEGLGGEQTVAMVALGAGVGGLGVRLPTTIACETLRDHLSGSASSSIRRVCFYGYSLPEFAAVAEVVNRYFPLGDDVVPSEVRRLWESEHARGEGP